MDVLAHYRLSLGLPGLSINWGPWGDAGMAASLSSRYPSSLGCPGTEYYCSRARIAGARASAGTGLGTGWCSTVRFVRVCSN